MITKKEVTKKASAAPAAKTKAVKKAEKKPAPMAHGVGRRKSAIARVWLRRGSGNLIVNDESHIVYFDTDVNRIDAYKPFEVIEQLAKQFDATAEVRGGGLHAQAGAVRLGIARALVEMNEELRPLLRSHDLLTVDSRLKERKKYGQKAARRKFQFVKR